MNNLTQISFKLRGYFVVAALSLLWVSCEKTPDTKPNEQVTDTITTGLLIGSEGNFQWGNASLSFIEAKTGKLYENIYSTVNQKSLGDVLQSITNHNEKLYLVLNNSGKIEILENGTFKSIGSITGLKSPRYLLPVGNEKAYVSDLYQGAISIVDLGSNTIKGEIPCAGWTEEILLSNGKVFVCNKYRSFVYVVSVQTDRITDSIAIGYGAISIVKDINQQLWVLTTGNNQNGATIKPQLHRIDPIQQTVTKSYDMPLGDLPLKLVTNKNGSSLYWLNKSVWKMDISDSELPLTPFISNGNRNFYGLGFDQYTNSIIVSDAKDYVQKSDVLHFDTLAQLIRKYNAGINTSFFLCK